MSTTVQPAPARQGSASVATILVVAALLVVGVLAVGGWSFRSEERAVRQECEANLRVIARLKVGQIVRWRAERLADARVIRANAGLAAEIAAWMQAPKPQAADRLLTWMRTLQQNCGYNDVLLVDPSGKVVLSSANTHVRICPEAMAALPAVLRDGEPSLSDLYAEEGTAGPHLSAIAPILAPGPGADAGPAVGAVVLVADVSEYLYPLIQAWPLPSDSAETLLVRRDGEDVLFLNELRHQKDTALKRRIPLTRQDVPAVMAVLGTEGVVEGLDYRGVKVLSAVAPVPGSPWFMVAKVDTAEALAAWQSHKRLILAMIAGALAAVLAGAGLLWQRQRKSYYRALYGAEAAARQAEKGRHAAEERYRTTLMSIGDGVIVTDTAGCVMLMNPVAERLTGWPQGEAQGRALDEVFRIINEETRQPVENPVARVMREQMVVGLANHTLLIARDGTERAIADSGAPVAAPGGGMLGVVLVFRDQTAERTAAAGMQALLSRQRTLLAAIPDIVMEVDANKVYTWANRAGIEFFGEDAIGREAAHYFEGEQNTYGVVKPLFNGDENVFYVESWQRRKDGQKRLLAWWCRVLKDSAGNVTGALSSAQDITERRQGEEALRASERFNREIIANARVGIIVYDRDLRILVWNPFMAELTGMPAPDVLGKVTTDLFPHIREQGVEVLLRQALAGQTVQSADIPYHVPRTGRSGWVVGVYGPQYGPDGTPVGVIGFIRDVSERKQAEAALNESASQIQALHNAIPDGVMVAAVDSLEILRVNPGACALFGYSEAEFVGKRVMDLHPAEHLDEVTNCFRSQALKAKVLAEGLPCRRKDGTIFFADISAQPLILGGRDCLVGVFRDITERKQIEARLRQSEKMDAIGQLAGGVAHDFNNQLAAILGYADMLATRLDDDEMRRYAENVVRAARRSAGLTRQLLAFARKSEMQRIPLNMHSVIGEVVAMLERSIDKRVRIKQRLEASPAHVTGDPTQLQNALLNLGLNARDAMPEGGEIVFATDVVTLGAESDRIKGGDLRPGAYLHVAVTDTGIGMSKEAMAHCFEPFFTTKEVGKGTGLGLASMYGTVRQHGGTVQVYSEPRHGTTFRIYLPLLEAPNPAPANAGDNPRPLQALRILLVDDETLVRELGQAMLEDMGHRVSVAADGAEAVALYRNAWREFDLVILDMIMPEMNGRDAYRAMREINPEAKVLLVSGFSRDGVAEELLLEGACGFLQKPFDANDLRTRLVEILAPGATDASSP